MRSGRVLGVVALATVTACPMREEEPPPGKAKVASVTAPAAAPSVRGRPVFVHPGPGDVPAAVRAEATGARERDVLVYVGATWCEPCQRFHDAVEKGDLDATFPRLTLVEFDLDRDRERLASAGYASKFIPLFVAPDKDGRASARRVEGSVKGPGAPADLTTRLRALLAP